MALKVGKGKKKWIWSAIVSGALLVVVLGVAIEVRHQKNNTAPTSPDLDIEDVSVGDVPEQKDTNATKTDATSSTKVKSAADYYNDGIIKFNQQDYSGAITDFDKAISITTQIPEYYNKKSQAEYNLGQKDQAIATVNEGLRYSPDSDLLKSRLDVLQKENFNNSFE